jgi:fructose-specific phosphotransferase system IIC component
MLKVSLLFALSLWLIVVVAGVLLWRVAVSTGTIGNFESFLATSLGEDSFTINGAQIFQGSLVVGLVFFATGAIFAVVTSVLFNLIAGVVGGIRTTVIELETARPTDTP